MREGWKYKTFGEVGTFLRGKSIQKADFVEHGLPCIHYGQIHTKFGVSVDKHLSEIPEDIYNKSIIASCGDVVIAITSEDLEGSCKSTAWLGDYDIAVSSHAAVYKHELNPKFIVYYLRSERFYVEKKKYARGFKVMEIKPTDIAKIPIPVPSVEIQTRIVSELDNINELIRLKKEQLRDYDKLSSSIFYEMFGNTSSFETKKLEDIYKFIDYRGKTPNKISSGIPLITAKNVRKGYLDYSVKDFISLEEYKDRQTRGIAKKGDLLFTTEAPLGYVALADLEEYSAGQRLIALQRKENNIVNTYSMYYMLSNGFQYELSRQATGSTAQGIKASKLKNMSIPIPPILLQQTFAKRIELIEQQKSEIQSTITNLETLLASRMQYWFD